MAVVLGEDRRGLRMPGGMPRRGFTLVELLATIAILSLLIAVLLPALAHTMRAARGFRCQMSLRSAAFDFSVFADETLHGSRGHDERDLARGRFRVETFQESQYGIDEFWRWEDRDSVSMPDARGNDPMRCAAVRGPVTLWRNMPCSQGAVTPAENVSYGLNMRLHRGEYTDSAGLVRTYSVKLTSDILEKGNVPLAWDVDGARASQQSAPPVFSAPSLESAGPLAQDRYWFPGMRHNGAANFAFVGGHVLASARPLAMNGWDWSYQGPR